MAGPFSPDLRALSELAASFARAYPALAPRLAEASADPDVERLLEAFTYLTERVHRLIDAGSPAAAHHFAALLTPELARPFPSATILELSPPRDRRIRVPAGTEFESLPVDGTRCRFRAWSRFDLAPWSIEDARVVWSASEGQALEVSVRASGRPSEGLAASLFPLRLHLGGDARIAQTLLLFLRTHLVDVQAWPVGAPSTAVTIAKRVVPWGLAADEPLLPPEPFEHPGFRLLREYFLLPAKLAFIELDLGALAPPLPPRFESATGLELRFRFDTQLPETAHVTRENIRINCVPVVNVFETTTDPVRPTLERPAHLLRPAGLPIAHGETYSVQKVLARVEGYPGVTEIAPFSDFDAASKDALPGVFYVARPTLRADGSRSEVELSLGSPVDGGVLPDIDFLSVEIRADNGKLPSALGIGDVCVPAASSPPGLSFRNVSAVTPHRSAAAGDELRWRVLASTALTALPLTDAETLKTLLHVLDLHPLADPQAARAETMRLAAVLDVREERAQLRWSSGGATTVVSGHDVNVVLSKTGFSGEGDALVFASVLARLFAHEASLGTFVRTRVRIAETGRFFAFPAMHCDDLLEDGSGC